MGMAGSARPPTPFVIEGEIFHIEDREQIVRLQNEPDNGLDKYFEKARWHARQVADGLATDTDAHPEADIFVVRDDLLYVVRFDGDPERQRIRAVLPPQCYAAALRAVHGRMMHAGITKTRRALNQRFWWPSLAAWAKRWVKSCVLCHSRKTPRPTHNGTPAIICDAPYPFHTIAIDLVETRATADGPYPYILTCIDVFSRYVIALPIQDKTAQGVAEALIERIFCIYGIPRVLINDNDDSLVGKAMTIVYDRWGIKPRRTTGYQPQANPVERWHRWLHQQMTILGHQFGPTWWTYLPATTYAYNISIHESTGYSPFELIFLRQPTIPADLIIELQATIPSSHRDYSINAAVRMKAAFQHVRKSQQYAAERNRDQRLKSAIPITFKKDDLVLKWEPALRREGAADKAGEVPIPSKWRMTWSGPHLVLGSAKPQGTHPKGNKYRIMLSNSGVEQEIHVNMLQLFTPWSDTILSSSGEFDDPRRWTDRGLVPIGNLFAVALGGAYNFGIGRVLKTIRAKDGMGDYLQYQWFGNNTNNLASLPIYPGWLRSSSSTPDIYYALEGDAGDNPYTGASTATPVRDSDVLLHSFILTKGNRVPAAIYRSISSASDRVERT